MEHLIAIRPFIEKELPGVEIYLACSDGLLYLAENQNRIIGQSKLVEMKWQFGYIRELKSDFVNHPVEKLLAESQLDGCLKHFYEEINPRPKR